MTNNGTFSERLKKLMGDDSRAEFAEKCEISVGALRNYLNDGMPSADKALRIARLFNVSIEWLIEGVQNVEPNKAQAVDFITIPRVDVHLAAGNGALNGDSIERVEDIPFTKEFLGGKLGRSSSDGLIILTADGDSMDPLIADGDLVMVDKKRNTLSDGVYAFVYGGLARVKYLRPTIQGDVELISQNPIHKDELLKRSDLEDFHIIGKVVWCGHRFS
ncbi:XRE family transcriptional regulator [Pseudovibrio sp. WM33]|uniref:XRE family transcriptional regulator n=1 Tax=Pseudovibrio sp. WM33 TaxID=1735585 RepID=UPI0007AE46B9|nr:XRE family transcriptional regulator [Pseudovibrio sp. WM33]KZL29445.1 putative HTH-type transcriptional regulator [Pseudovibrio sp. WM33]